MKYCPICERTYGDEVGVCEVDSTPLRNSGPMQDSLIGKTIKDRYRVIEKLGEGGMAAVYLAEQVNIERRVALKVLHGEYARDEKFVRRFRQEARLAASLSHRNVIQIYDFDQADDGNLFIAMEYLSGRNLKELVQEGPLDVARVARLGIQIADGLGAAHRAGVIHRDIKLENIMVVGREEDIKLMDFGIARLREVGSSTRLTRAGMVMGTPAYMAPEQIEGGEVSEKTDIYAFGIVLYEMLSGVVPFRAATPAAVLMKHLKEIPVPLRKLRGEVPPSVESVVTQALEKKPARRPANMEEIAEVLRKAESKLPQEPLPKTLLFTQPLEVIKEGGTRQPSLRDLLGKIQTAVASWLKHVPVAEKGKEVQAEEAIPGRVSGIPGAEQATPAGKTVLATVAVTQPLEALKPRGMNWRWVGLGVGVVLVGLVAVLVGVVVYRQIQDRGGERVARVEGKTEGTPLNEGRIVSLVIRAERGELGVAERVGVGVRAEYADGRQEEVSEGVEWRSSDQSVVVVVGGEMEGRGVGNAEVMAQYKGVEATPLTVTVKETSPIAVAEARLVSIAIHSKKREINVKERLMLRAKGRYFDGRESELKKGVQWESSDRSVARVNSKGELEGQREGKAEITARYEGIVSEPLGLAVKAAPERRGPDVAKSPGVAKEADIKGSIMMARSYRDRGDYPEAIAELEKARKIDPANKEIEAEIVATRRACNAERKLGRPELKC